MIDYAYSFNGRLKDITEKIAILLDENNVEMHEGAVILLALLSTPTFKLYPSVEKILHQQEKTEEE